MKLLIIKMKMMNGGKKLKKDNKNEKENGKSQLGVNQLKKSKMKNQKK